MPFAAVRLAGGDIILEEFGMTKLITLSREKSLNALTWKMVQALRPLYDKWISESSPCAIVLRGAGTKAFCAGGDVVSLVKNETPGVQDYFFKEEYTLNHMIGSLQKRGIPHVALLDGIVMGGGVGLSVHGSIRICNESTIFAMPECAIGLFPDVGGSIFLPRLPIASLGYYLALSGRRLKGSDVVLAGVGTHFVPRSKFPALTDALKTASSTEHITAIVDSFAMAVDKSTFSISSDALELINDAFTCSGDVKNVLEVLKKTSSQKEFADGLLKDLTKGSPTSMKLTWEQLKRGAKNTPEENYKMEYRLAEGCLTLAQDFKEGVRAALIEKTGSPRWNPATLDEVSDDYVQTFFNTVPKTGDLDLKPLVP